MVGKEAFMEDRGETIQLLREEGWRERARMLMWKCTAPFINKHTRCSCTCWPGHTCSRVSFLLQVNLSAPPPLPPTSTLHHKAAATQLVCVRMQWWRRKQSCENDQASDFRRRWWCLWCFKCVISRLEFRRLGSTFATCCTAVIAQIIDNSFNTGAENLSSYSVYSINVTDINMFDVSFWNHEN